MTPQSPFTVMAPVVPERESALRALLASMNSVPGCADPRLPAPDGSPTDVFSIPQADGPDQRLGALPQFVKVVGGAYFFMPGIRALHYLAAAT
jgi:hypothetical protein